MTGASINAPRVLPVPRRVGMARRFTLAAFNFLISFSGATETLSYVKETIPP
jgi:hypothetical protein